MKDNKISEIIKLYKNGETLKGIGLKYGVSKQYIEQEIKKLGVKKELQDERKRGKKQILRERFVCKVCGSKHWRDSGKSIRCADCQNAYIRSWRANKTDGKVTEEPHADR